MKGYTFHERVAQPHRQLSPLTESHSKKIYIKYCFSWANRNYSSLEALEFFLGKKKKGHLIPPF